MAVQAQLGGLAGFFPPSGGFADELWAHRDYGALLSSSAAAAAGNKGYHYDCAAAGVASAAQSELTCNGGVPSRKRVREDDGFDHHVVSSSAALLPILGMQRAAVAADRTSPATASTSGRSADIDAVAAELCRQGASEIDALVAAELDRLRAVLEQAHKRQRLAVARAAAAAAARLFRAKGAELDAARRRTAELEDRLRQAAAESQVWCGVARSNEAVAAGLRAALDTLLLRGGAAGVPPAAAEEGFGDSGAGLAAAVADDAESCFVVEADEDAAAASPASCRWACGGGEASVLLLPCRHLCLCKACETRVDACPVCFAVKNAAIHVAGAN